MNNFTNISFDLASGNYNNAVFLPVIKSAEQQVIDNTIPFMFALSILFMFMIIKIRKYLPIWMANTMNILCYFYCIGSTMQMGMLFQGTFMLIVLSGVFGVACIVFFNTLIMQILKFNKTLPKE